MYLENTGCMIRCGAFLKYPTLTVFLKSSIKHQQNPVFNLHTLEELLPAQDDAIGGAINNFEYIECTEIDGMFLRSSELVAAEDLFCLPKSSIEVGRK